jgi:FlaG/FlaF family flagellin (archaellin)
MGRRPSAWTPARLWRTRLSRRTVIFEIVLVSLLFALTPGEAWAAPPANDDFDNATVISSLETAYYADTREATTAADDPDCYGKNRTVWYAFTPVDDIYIKASTNGTDYDTTLSAYAGSRGALTQIACNAVSNLSPIEFLASGGTTYHFMIGSVQESGGNLTFGLFGFTPPANDDFDSATAVASTPFTDSVDTRGASTAPDDPACGSTHSVWYAFTPAQNMVVSADTFGSSFTAALSVHTGSRGALTELACRTGSVEFDATGGTTYYFMVGESNTFGSGGDLTFSVHGFLPPANDDFTSATLISSLPFSDAVDTRGATAAGDDPPCGSRKGVWYTFTPHEDMRVVPSAAGSDYATTMSVHTGTRGALVEVACVSYPHISPQIPVEGGTTYHFLVGTYYPDSPGGSLAFSFTRFLSSSTLELTISARQVNYKRFVTVKAHLDVYAEAGNKMIEIYKTPLGGTKTLVASGEFDDSGNFSARVQMKKKTTFMAEWAGDQYFLPATSNTKVVEVRVITKTKLSGHYGTSGRYKLYHAGDDPKQTGTVIPNHAGKRLDFVAQVSVGGNWVTIATARPRIRASGSVSLRLIDPAPGYNYRARNSFDGDRDHLGDSSPWAYFRVTG